jgi:hypothetical protein
LTGTEEQIKKKEKERKETDREIFRLKNEISKLNEDSTAGVLRIETEANAKRIKMEEDYYAKTKEIKDKLKQDAQSVIDEYNNAVESRANSIYTSYGLFDKVEKTQDGVNARIAALKEELTAWERTQQQYKIGTEKRKQADAEVAKARKELADAEREKITGAGLMKNLEDQVREIEFWKNNLKVLSLRGADADLIKELEAMGPKSVDQIQALNQLSKPELDRYVMLWKSKHKSAMTQAISELEGMLQESIQKIKDLGIDSEIELDAYSIMWGKQLTGLSKETIKQIDGIKKDWLDRIGTIRTDTEKEFETLTENVVGIIGQPNWSDLGSNIIGGIITGVLSKEEQLAKTMADIAKRALEVPKEELGINSPSKEFAKIGVYAMRGVINGLNSLSGLLYTTCGDLGSTAKDSLKYTFSNIMSAFSGDLDMTPVIRPVLDGSNIEGGLASIFSKNRGLDVSEITAKVANVSSRAKGAYGSETTANQTDNSRNTAIQITNNYTVRSNDDIRKISADLKNTLDRYNYAKGVAVV